MSRTIVLWLHCGPEGAWNKRPARRPRRVDRGPLEAVDRSGRFLVDEQLGQRGRKLLGRGDQRPRAEVRQLAGLASWMAGEMPQLQPFTA